MAKRGISGLDGDAGDRALEAMFALASKGPAVSNEAPARITGPPDDIDITDDVTEEEALEAISGLTGDSPESPDSVFCREYLATGSAKQAVIRAGIVDSQYSIDVVARRTLERPEIQAAIAVLRDLGVKREPVVVTRDLILDESQVLYEVAKESGQVSAGVSALKLQAQLLGLLDQTVTVNHTMAVTELPLSELRRLAAERLMDPSGDGGARMIEGSFREVVREVDDDD